MGPNFIALLSRVRIILPPRVGVALSGRTPTFGTLPRSDAHNQLSQGQSKWGVFVTQQALSTDSTISPMLPLQVVSQLNISQSKFFHLAFF
jgi:hypothetical protein